MTDEYTRAFGLTTECKKTIHASPLNQRGHAFLKLVLASWIIIGGGGLVLDASGAALLGLAMLAVPAIYLYVSENVPAELSDEQRMRLKQRYDAEFDIYDNVDDSSPIRQAGHSQSRKKIRRNTARMKYRMLRDQRDMTHEEILEHIREHTGYSVSIETLEEWTQDLRS